MIDSRLNSVTDDSLAKTPPNFNYEVKTCQEVSTVTDSAPSFHLQLLPVSFHNSGNVPLPHLTVFCPDLLQGLDLPMLRLKPSRWRVYTVAFNKNPYGVQFQLHPVQNFKAFLRVNILTPGGNLNALMPLESGGKLVQQVKTPWRTHEGRTGRSPSWERKFNKHVDKHIFYCTGEPGDQF